MAYLPPASITPLDKGIEHQFAASLVEVDGELGAIDSRDGSGAEFDVEYPRARRKTARRIGTGDNFAFDGRRLARRRLVGALLRTAPARRFVFRAEGIHIGETRLGVAAIVRSAAGVFDQLHMVCRQVVDETRRRRGLPQAMNAAIAGEQDFRPQPRPRHADIGEAALLLQPGAAALVERTLVRKQAL